MHHSVDCGWHKENRQITHLSFQLNNTLHGKYLYFQQICIHLRAHMFKQTNADMPDKALLKIQLGIALVFTVCGKSTSMSAILFA